MVRASAVKPGSSRLPTCSAAPLDAIRPAGFVRAALARGCHRTWLMCDDWVSSTQFLGFGRSLKQGDTALIERIGERALTVRCRRIL